MNRTRRNALNEASALLEKAREIIIDVCEEEQNAMDNMPENLQESEKHSAMEDAVDSMWEAVSGIDEVLDSINEAIGQ